MKSIDRPQWKIDIKDEYPLSEYLFFGDLYTATYPDGSDPVLVQRINHEQFDENKEQVIWYVDLLLKIKKSAAPFLPALKEMVQTDDFLYIVFYSPPKVKWDELKRHKDELSKEQKVSLFYNILLALEALFDNGYWISEGNLEELMECICVDSAFFDNMVLFNLTGTESVDKEKITSPDIKILRNIIGNFLGLNNKEFTEKKARDYEKGPLNYLEPFLSCYSFKELKQNGKILSLMKPKIPRKKLDKEYSILEEINYGDKSLKDSSSLNPEFYIAKEISTGCRVRIKKLKEVREEKLLEEWNKMKALEKCVYIMNWHDVFIDNSSVYVIEKIEDLKHPNDFFEKGESFGLSSIKLQIKETIYEKIEFLIKMALGILELDKQKINFGKLEDYSIFVKKEMNGIVVKLSSLNCLNNIDKVKPKYETDYFMSNIKGFCDNYFGVDYFEEISLFFNGNITELKNVSCFLDSYKEKIVHPLATYFRLNEKGRGDTAIVYKCFEEKTGIVYAMKKIRSDFRDQFISEAELLKKLKCDTIIHYQDHFEFNGSYYIVMEYMESDLEQYRNSPEFFNAEVDTQIKIIKRIAKAIASAFLYLQKNVPDFVHGDLKVNNILIKCTGGDLLVRLSDFGFYTAKESKSFQEGTEFFRGPEKVIHKTKSDVWSFGFVILVVASESKFEDIATLTDKEEIYQEFEDEVLEKYGENEDESKKLLEFLESCLMPKPKDRRSFEELLTSAFLT